MNECIFCKIVAGDIPSEKILDDAQAYAFLDIGPVTEGHILLIPKTHYTTLDQIPAREISAISQHLPALVQSVQKATVCEGVNVLQNNGKIAHQEIPHVHFHIIPRYQGDAFQFNWPAGEYEAGRMQELGKDIRSNLL